MTREYRWPKSWSAIRGEAVDEAGERARMTGHEELVILAAARRPGERVAADRRGHGPHGGAQGEPRELDPCTDPALLGDVAEVGGETVGEVDHGRHAARGGEPLALAHARRRTQVRGLHLVERRRRHARGRRPAFKHGEPGGGRRVAAAEVDGLDEEVGRREHETPCARLQDGTVVADPDADSSPSRAGAADDLDQLAFGGARAHGREVARKFFRSCLPSIVRIDSGWNCTPSTGWRRWRSPMISPSSATAVTSSVPGTVSVKTASE